MADDLYGSNKRKFDDDQGVGLPPPTRRATGFSAPLTSPVPDTAAAAASAADDFLAAKQRAQEIASRILRNAEANQSKPENGDASAIPPDHSQKPLGQPIMSQFSMTTPSSIPSYGYQGPSKKIEIPNGRVGVIIGRGGENIKNLQLQSGAKIQVTRDMDANPYSQTRMVELVGSSEQINKAEQLINEILAEADAGGTGVVSGRRVGGNVAFSAEQFSMKVPSNKVGLIIGKGGETIKNMQAKSGARIQIIPLHLPPGDTLQERTVQIDGTKEQIEAAEQLVNEVTSGEFQIILEWERRRHCRYSFGLFLSSVHRLRNPQVAGGYSQQGYHQPQLPTWGPPGAPQMQQQPGYGYMQPGAYPAQPPQYNLSQPAFGGYPSAYPDQTSNQQTQQTTTGTGYDYYGQQQPAQQQPVGGSAAPVDNNSYNYSQPPLNYSSQGSYGDPAYSQPTSVQQKVYGQDSYSAAYQAQPAYAQSASTTQSGYDHQKGYGSNPAYPPQDGSAPAYSTQGVSTQVSPTQQAPPPVQASATQQGYTGQPPSSNAASYPSQPGHGSQVPAGGYMQSPSLTPPTYGQPPQGQKPPPAQLPPTSQAGYVQSGYGQPPPAQSGYPQVPPPSDYVSGRSQSGYGQPPAYGSVPPQGQGYGGAYSQPSAYSTESAAHGAYDAPSAASAVPSGVAKVSPQS